MTHLLYHTLMYPLSYLFGLKRYQNGAWFEPSTEQQIFDVVQLLAIRLTDRIAELGAGDGRAVLALSKTGAHVVGFEKDEKLTKAALFPKNAEMVCADFWDVDLSGFNKVYLYQFKTVMPRLEKKLLDELPLGALVASNTWKFPNWKITETLDDIHLYIKD